MSPRSAGVVARIIGRVDPNVVCCPACTGEWYDPDDPRPLVHLEVTEDGLVVTCARCGHEARASVMPQPAAG